MKQKFDCFGDGTVTLRPLQGDDLALTLAWRNRHDARVWFKSSAEISPQAHRAWFESYILKEDDYVFIVEADGRPVGQCAVYGIDAAAGSAEVGRFLVAADAAGNGYMRRSCALLIDFATRVLRLRYLYLEVFADNARALHLYAASGFGEEARDGQLIRMGLDCASSGGR